MKQYILFGTFLLGFFRCEASEGYILYCPCMGRFGNQADHFLGSLAFAKALNRTLVLPPWVEYHSGKPKSVQVPFDTYFNIKKLEEYTSVMTMETFMQYLAPTIWPEGKRIVFCFTSRGETEDCNAKEGNPFAPFWNTFNVNFDRSEFYSPLHYDTHHYDTPSRWNERYPANTYPVLAFTGAPASFPVQKENRELQKYLTWSDSVNYKAHKFIKDNLPVGTFVGIHLRNGIDWVRTCEHTKTSPLLFASPQCLGYKGEHGPLERVTCFPDKDIILKQLRRAIKAIKARAVFVASDNDHMINEINENLKSLKVHAYKYPVSDPHTDLAILGRANHFIGNCVSSFTAFVKRERDVMGLPSSFWAFPPPIKNPAPHEEF